MHASKVRLSALMMVRGWAAANGVDVRFGTEARAAGAAIARGLRDLIPLEDVAATMAAAKGKKPAA
jgi:hypothetical protein